MDGGTVYVATSFEEHMKELLYHSATSDGSTNGIPYILVMPTILALIYYEKDGYF